MRWPWSHTPDTSGKTEVETSRERERESTRTREEMERIAAEIREERRRNHFAPMVYEAMKPRGRR